MHPTKKTSKKLFSFKFSSFLKVIQIIMKLPEVQKQIRKHFKFKVSQTFPYNKFINVLFIKANTIYYATQFKLF